MVFLRPETKVKYRLEKGIAIPYHQQKTYRCQENFEVLMSCIIKYTSKSIYVKYLSKSKNDIPPSKHLYSQSNSVFFCLFFSSVMKSAFPFADVVEVWIFMMTLLRVHTFYHHHKASEIGLMTLVDGETCMWGLFLPYSPP